jgi:hypothetical protein
MSKPSKAQILDDVDGDSVDSSSKTSVVDYGVEDVPPLATALFLGLQVHFQQQQQQQQQQLFNHSNQLLNFIKTSVMR